MRRPRSFKPVDCLQEHAKQKEDSKKGKDRMDLIAGNQEVLSNLAKTKDERSSSSGGVAGPRESNKLQVARSKLEIMQALVSKGSARFSEADVMAQMEEVFDLFG